MHDPDPKCRHFGIFAKKSDRKSDPIFPILSDFFRFLDFSWLLDFPIPQLQLTPYSDHWYFFTVEMKNGDQKAIWS